MTAEHELRAALAASYADAADRAADAEDAAALQRAGDKLLEVLDTLPARREAVAGGVPRDGVDDRGKLLQLMDSPPVVGDSADA